MHDRPIIGELLFFSHLEIRVSFAPSLLRYIVTAQRSPNLQFEKEYTYITIHILDV